MGVDNLPEVDSYATGVEPATSRLRVGRPTQWHPYGRTAPGDTIQGVTPE